MNRAEVRDPPAYLRRVLTRLCLDEARSARARREVYVGPWLPEPLVQTEPVSAHDVSVAFLLALERLSPAERAAFLLHDVFEADFEEVGQVLGRTPTTARKLASRARSRIRAAKPRFEVPESRARALVEAFVEAARSGDRARFTDLLAADAELHTDGGGLRRSALRVIHGSDRIARFFAGLHRRRTGLAYARLTPSSVNGLPGLLVETPNGDVETCAFAFDGEQISGIFIVRNPEKLDRVATDRSRLPML